MLNRYLKLFTHQLLIKQIIVKRVNLLEVYADNAATSFPKAEGITEAMCEYLLRVGGNINRGAYSKAYKAENLIYETRELLCDLFNFDKPENVILTGGITQSLNILIKGLLREGDHVIVSALEHNAVMRPLNSLLSKGISYTKCPCDSTGNLNMKALEALFKDNTKAVIMLHASNVCGAILPLEMVGKLCKEKGAYFIIDSAQSAGFCTVDFKKLRADAIAFTGHKSLMGPQGTGGFLISPRLSELVEPLIEGGTGSLSDLEIQPSYLPDKYESGTMNIPGVYGFNAALKYINKIGMNSIREKELMLTERFIKGIEQIDKVRLIGPKGIEGRTAVVSVDFQGLDCGEISYILDKRYGILTRSGLHCSPSAHKALGTFPRGTVRFSFSHFNTAEEIDYILRCLKEITKG